LKSDKATYQPALFELESHKFDAVKSVDNGKIFTLEKDETGDGKINVEDLQWTYLEGTGDFRSEEVKRLRDEADFIVTNPPFSLFREFVAWIKEKDKKYALIGNMNAITYKEIFPLIKENKMWLGASIHSGDREFEIPSQQEIRSKSLRTDKSGKTYVKVDGVRWFTNIDHGRRHVPLSLMSMADNKKFSKHKIIKGVGYIKYDNYDAIEISFTDAIPSDYEGVMGVPISFLSKYNPDQFEILGSRRWAKDEILSKIYTGNKTAITDLKTLINGKETYDRIFIKHKKKGNK
jgi:hypothetical protein